MGENPGRRALQCGLAALVLLAGIALLWKTSFSTDKRTRPSSVVANNSRDGGSGTTPIANPGAPGQVRLRPRQHERTHSSDAAPPAGLALSATATMTSRELEVVQIVNQLLDECYALAEERNPGLRGVLKMSVEIFRHDNTDHPGHIVVDLDEEQTTVNDPELIECATENVFAAEEILDALKAAGTSIGGSISVQVGREFPPPPKKSADWPPDDSSPKCPPSTALVGQLGDSQWCERDGGEKHGDQFNWHDGKIRFIQVWQDGESVVGRIRPNDR